VVDTWWQTESGGILVSPIPNVTPLVPGSACKPLPGIDAHIFTEKGNPAKPGEEGHLVVSKPWPGMMTGVFGNPEKFKANYFARFPGYYLSGDGAKQDEQGNYWLMGRLDDVINVSGHRFSTAEMEDAFNQHPAVAESSVVGIPHQIKGEAIYAFVRLNTEEKVTDALIGDLRRWVRKLIGPIATPEYIQIAESLPKTRSGKIMRRVLRKIVSNQTEDLGDLTTLTDPSVVDVLVAEFNRLTRQKTL
jgi:Acyl-coenzyme A synthetases/AMP-(fatty) acid ligases